MRPKIEIAYVHNPTRSHKLLPLFGELPVIEIRNFRDALRLRNRPNLLVVTDNFGKSGLVGAVGATLARAPFVVRLRGDFFREELERAADRQSYVRWIKYLLNIVLARLCLRKARVVICNSRYLESAIQPFLERDKMTAVVHNPYTPLQPSPRSVLLPSSESGFRLLTVTNMTLCSKVGPLIEAMGTWMPRSLWEELDIRWVIFGEGYHQDSIRRVVSERQLGERVHLMGKSRVGPETYEWCDVVLHPTGMDAFPNVPMEAFMNGRPVITNTESCGTREQVFDDYNGFVVDDSVSFVAALRAYSDDPDLRARHAEAGRSLVEREFSMDSQRLAMSQVLSGLVAGGYTK